jgi:hypothetical protein
MLNPLCGRCQRGASLALLLVAFCCKKEDPMDSLGEGEDCRLDGRVYKHLAEVPSPDCNRCHCSNGMVACTLLPCEVVSAGGSGAPGGGPDGGAKR